MKTEKKLKFAIEVLNKEHAMYMKLIEKAESTLSSDMNNENLHYDPQAILARLNKRRKSLEKAIDVLVYYCN